MPNVRTRIAAGLVIAALTGTGIVLAHAQGVSPDKAHIEHRRAVMSGSGVAGVSLARMAAGLIEPQNVAELTRYWALGAKLSEDAFVPDTRDAGIDSRSRDAVWEDWDDFSERMREYAADVEALAALAEAGDTEAALGGVRDVLQDHCKDCHDEYRTEE